MDIRVASEAMLKTVLGVELDAFDNDSEILALVTDLNSDASAKPMISLLAYDNDQAVGHVYFTQATLTPNKENARCMILAPLAVVKKQQKGGVGKRLIAKALEMAKEMGIEIVFVLGHSTYYPRSGFVPAGQFGFFAPYPIEEKDAAAWMV